MGFLKNFFTNVYANETIPRHATGFNQLSDAELEAHLGVARYGDFELSDAVRPSYSLDVVPSAGFRHDVEAALSKAGCNAGTCHGSPTGKNGFRLSLRGYDPEFDYVNITRDMLGRRVDRNRPPRRASRRVSSRRCRAGEGSAQASLPPSASGPPSHAVGFAFGQSGIRTRHLRCRLRHVPQHIRSSLPRHHLRRKPWTGHRLHR